MEGQVKLPLLDDVLPGGLRFGANYLVEFEPQSLWYEASFTLCAQALREGQKTDYHTFTRPPDEVRTALSKLGIDVERLEEDDTFRIWDSFTVQTGMGEAARIGKATPRERVDLRSVKIADWDRGVTAEVGGEVPDVDRRRLHIDDNTSILLQFNDEKSVIEHFRTLTVPYARKFEMAAVHSIPTGIYSEGLSRQFESFCDGVIDLRSREEGDSVGHFMRLRFARGAEHDSRWRHIGLLGNGEVTRTVSPASPDRPLSSDTTRNQYFPSTGTQSERRLAAIMFTDLVGFTALAQRDEDLAMSALEGQRRLVRPLLAKHRGREVKTIGDAFLVEFVSALDAVNCAIAIQDEMAVENGGRPDKSRVMMRIGIHLGDVIHSGTDVAGDAVNVASRIEPLARPGGICVTGQVYQSVVNKVGRGFRSLGSPSLRNVVSPVDVFEITASHEEGETLPPPGGAPARNRVAILPFSNISPDPKDEFFADGMTEELISSVSRTEGLRVIARTSVMRYKAEAKPVSEIGRELGVGSVLEGSVRRAGDKIRVTVQLVDAVTEEPKWSEDYDRDLRDIFSIQQDISQKVASALKVRILQAEDQPRGKAQTSDLEAYQFYLRGRQLWSKRTGPDLAKSVDFFKEAVRIDLGYGRAYSGLADAYATLALLEIMKPDEAFPKAKAAVQKALAIDNMSSEAHTSLGLVKFQYDWDWTGAEAEFVRAMELNQNYAPAHQFFADYLKAMGRFEEAIGEMERARELDPLSLAISAGLGHVLYLSRQYDRAIEQYRKTVELDPNFMQTHLWFGRPYLEKGMYGEAISELKTAVGLSGQSTLALGMLGHGLASAGQMKEANEILGKLSDRAKEAYVPSYWVAAVYNGMKDRDRTMEWLKRAYDERSSWLVWVGVEPRFDWLRGDPEFGAMLGYMKFPPTAFNH
ncbi:MAG: hypothetical protein HY296_02265 [Thaumarchaeota archaeon]|nr:hypothetical protein [Nitrososphaerota archaeon]